MVILMMILGILGGLVAAASLWLGGAGLWLAFLGYVAGAAMGGVMLTLWIIARATLPEQYQQLPDEILFKGILDQLVQQTALADTFDGLGGVVSRERSLQIMKDSRIGTYGGVALVFSLSIRIALLSTLASEHIVLATLGLIASHSFGRSAAVAVMSLLPYAGDIEHAKAKPLAVSVPREATTAAMLWSIAIFAVCIVIDAAFGVQFPSFKGMSTAHWFTVLLATGAVVFVMRRWLHRRLGGYTGDTLGATEQLGEIAVLLSLACQWRVH